jgi:hypothetical protein
MMTQTWGVGGATPIICRAVIGNDDMDTAVARFYPTESIYTFAVSGSYPGTVVRTAVLLVLKQPNNGERKNHQ